MTQKTAREILNDPFLNKGTAFTEEERAQLGLTGMLPPHVQTIDEQAAQAYAQMETKTSMLEKRLFLMEILTRTARCSTACSASTWKSLTLSSMIRPSPKP